MLNNMLDNKLMVFEDDILVMVNHINYGNHLGYDSVLSIIQEVRMRFLKNLNLSEVSIENDIGYIITEANIEYKSEAFHGDELHAKMYIQSINTRSMEIYCILENAKNSKKVALCTTKHLFFNYKTRKVSNISEHTINSLTLGKNSSRCCAT
jgi:acyl-CoA thioesterase FadM